MFFKLCMKINHHWGCIGTPFVFSLIKMFLSNIVAKPISKNKCSHYHFKLRFYYYK